MNYVGLTAEAATQRAQQSGFVVFISGSHQMLVNDHNPRRITFEVDESGIVTSVTVG